MLCKLYKNNSKLGTPNSNVRVDDKFSRFHRGKCNAGGQVGAGMQTNRSRAYILLISMPSYLRNRALCIKLYKLRLLGKKR
jgi:hypothetical protein